MTYTLTGASLPRKIMMMSRPLRIDVQGGWYHITARGHNRQAIFLDEGDRLHFLKLLGEMASRHRVEIHAYVLMGNHYHLLIRTPEANASQAIQWLNVSYSIWWNRRHCRCGSLFQGRFKGVVVEGGGWLLRLSEYLHLNPVAIQKLDMGKRNKGAENRGWRKPTMETARRRLEALRAYRWSSYRTYSGYAAGPQWLMKQEVLARVKGGREGYRKALEDRLLSGYVEPIWNQLRWSTVLGSEKFAEAMREKIQTGRETSGRTALRRRVTWEQVVSWMEQLKGEPWEKFRDRQGDWGRDVAVWAARQWGGYALAELAERIGGVDYTAVAQGVRRLKVRSEKDKALRNMMDRMQQTVELSYVKT